MTDGTVTEVLEAYTGESMRLVKLEQDTRTLDRPLPGLEASAGEYVMHRKILLQGSISLTNYVFAETYLAIKSLDERTRDALTITHKPIGQLIRDGRIETFREILKCGVEPAGSLAEHFHLHRSDPLVFRVYRILAGQRPLMQITERFPELI
jgi:chorismate-pyruvate lyase